MPMANFAGWAENWGSELRKLARCCQLNVGINKRNDLLRHMRMYKCLLIVCLLSAQIGKTQAVNHFQGKWAFTGLRTTVFRVENEKLYVGMLDYTDTSNFNRFVRGLPLPPEVFSEASVSESGDSTLIEADFPSIDHRLKLLYVPGDSNHIFYSGDVFFDSSRTIVTNNNCSVVRPVCVNRLYSENDLRTMMHLKTADSFTRDDAFEFLLRLNEKLKLRCNRCYAGFTDAYMNEVLIEMGFNPIVKRTAVNAIWYNTSGFTFYVKSRFSDDQRVVKMIGILFDWYLK
jgi:hypothetical protein